MLKVEKINVNIAKVQVLRDLSLEIDEGEIACLVGPNGAGKTTTLRSIMGLIPAFSGKVIFRGEDITRLPAHERAKLGIGYAPEDRRLYPEFTVWENIVFPAKIMSVSEEEIAERVFRIFPELKDQTNRLAFTLSGGQQKMVAVARALAIDPTLILLDEPLEGLAPIVRSRLADGIKSMKDEGISVLLAESNISYVRDVADRIYRIKRGEIVEA
jgi:branched-chain amino acid transport system ATP-binding protein